MSDVHRDSRPGGKLFVVEPGDHASAAECDTIEAAARGAGFAPADPSRLKRGWAVTLVKG